MMCSRVLKGLVGLFVIFALLALPAFGVVPGGSANAALTRVAAAASPVAGVQAIRCRAAMYAPPLAVANINAGAVGAQSWIDVRMCSKAGFLPPLIERPRSGFVRMDPVPGNQRPVVRSGLDYDRR